MWAAAAAVAAAVVAVPGAAQAGPSDAHAGTQALLDQQLRVAPGAAVLAGDANGSWSLHAGTGQFGKDKPIQPADHFRIGSQTKTFTAAVVLQLVDEGKLALDTPIENYLPGVVDGNGYDGNQITIRELLQHRTGIPSFKLVGPGVPNPNTPDGSYSLSEVVRAGLKAKPNSAPGTTFEYSNINFNILGLLIEKLTGTPVGDAITQRVIQPLGLTDTSFPRGGDRTLPAPYVQGYVVVSVGPFNSYLTVDIEPSFYSNAGGMISTMADLATFDRALAAGKVVSPSALAEMRKTVPWFAGEAYGLGYSSHALSCGGLAWGHGGDVYGHSSWTLTTDDGRYATMTSNNMRPVNDSNGNDNRLAILDSAICGH